MNSLTESTEVTRIEAESRTEVPTLIMAAQALVVTNGVEEQAAADLRGEITARKKKILEWFSPLTAAAFAAHRALTRRCAAAIEPYEAPIKIIDQKLTAYRTDCERQRKEAAEASMGNGDEIVAPPDTSFPEKVDGISYSEHWSAVVEDLTLLQNAVAEGKAPRQSTEAAQKFLDGLAKSLKSELNIPGVKAVCEKRVRSR